MKSVKKYSTQIIITAIILVVAGAMAYVLLRPQEAVMPGGHTTTDESQPAQDDPAQQPALSVQGRYEEYSETAFNQTRQERRVLFFHAPWCPQCRALDASIQESTVPAGVVIFKVDYDSQQTLRQKYGVTIQTTLVEVSEDGGEVQKYVAYDDPVFSVVMAAMNL